MIRYFMVWTSTVAIGFFAQLEPFSDFFSNSMTDYISDYALIARNISRVICPKLVKMAIFKTP